MCWQIHLKPLLVTKWKQLSPEHPLQRREIIVGILFLKISEPFRQEKDWTLPPPKNTVLLQVSAQQGLLCAFTSREMHWVQIIYICWRYMGSKSLQNIWGCKHLCTSSWNHQKASWWPWDDHESYHWFSVSSVQKIKLCKSKPLWMPNFNVILNICFSQHLIQAIINLTVLWKYAVLVFCIDT